MATNFGHHEATYLSNLVNSGAFNRRTDVLEVVLAALRSSDSQWIIDVTKWVKVQDLGVQEEVREKRKLFHEPTPRMLTGQIYTGETVPSGYKAMWPLAGFERGHMEISAASGGGKSTFANFIAPQIAQHVPVTVLDPLDQHHVVLPPNFGILDFKDYRRNPFEPPHNMEPMAYVRQVAEWMRDLFDFSAVSKVVLVRKCTEILEGGGRVSIPTIIERLNSRDASEGAILERLHQLPEGFHCEHGMNMARMVTRSFILNIAEADILTRKFILHDYLCFFSFQHPARPSWKLNHVLISHESLDFTRRDECTPFIGRMLRQIRNHGLGTIWLEQAPHTAHDDVRANITSRIIMQLAGDMNLAGLHSALGLDKEQAQAILNLPSRAAIIRRNDIPFPFMIRVPDIRLREVPAEEIAERKRTSVDYLRTAPPRKGQPSQKRNGSDIARSLTPGMLAYLADLEKNPETPVTERDKQLGINPRIGNEMRKKLKVLGLVEEIDINPGGIGRKYKTLRTKPALKEE